MKQLKDDPYRLMADYMEMSQTFAQGLPPCQTHFDLEDEGSLEEWEYPPPGENWYYESVSEEVFSREESD